MRRVLILLFVLLVPIKAIGAAVVPILGCPNHHSAAHAAPMAGAGANDATQMASHAGCDDMAQSGALGSHVPHDGGCPHLAMATVLATTVSIERDATVPPIDAAPARPLRSVVLDILLPPPTLNA